MALRHLFKLAHGFSGTAHLDSPSFALIITRSILGNGRVCGVLQRSNTAMNDDSPTSHNLRRIWQSHVLPPHPYSPSETYRQISRNDLQKHVGHDLEGVQAGVLADGRAFAQGDILGTAYLLFPSRKHYILHFL